MTQWRWYECWWPLKTIDAFAAIASEMTSRRMASAMYAALRVNALESIVGARAWWRGQGDVTAWQHRASL